MEGRIPGRKAPPERVHSLIQGPLSGAETSLLLVLPKGIGDVVYGLALVEALKRRHPQLEITWAVHPMAAPLLTHASGVQTALPYTTGARSLLQLRRDLRGKRFDLVLNLGMYLHALPPALLASSARTLCFDRGYAKDALQWFHRESIPVAPGLRVFDAFSRAGSYLGLESSPPAWHWSLDSRERGLRDEFFASAHGPRIAFLPCSGRPEKDWPKECWSELAAKFVDTGAFVVIVGGPGAQEKLTADFIAGQNPAVRVAVGNDLSRVLWILSACDLVVGSDTGPLHLARALGVPLVGLYGHTDPDRYGPYPPFRGSLIDRYHYDDSTHSSKWTGTGGRSGRMQLIKVAEVDAACRRLLGDTQVRDESRAIP